jgi:endonuclease YncB( thermonuclease family)
LKPVPRKSPRPPLERGESGDSLAAKGHDIEIKVRLMGIDAPETG